MLYGVHLHVIKLLEELHTGTEAVVPVDGEVGRSSTVKAGVRQGCLPPDKQFGVQIITNLGGALLTNLISRIVALMYADNLALLADSPDNSVVLLGMVAAIASEYGLFH
eukprot:362292-Chlamydomonas_euryale.AAC.5